METITGKAITILIGLGYCESYWLMVLLISACEKFKSSMYQIAISGTILHVLNLFFYTVVMDYQLSPYLMGDQGIGTWALISGVMVNLINIHIYLFITVRMYTFMKVNVYSDS
jgi:hypothetical protein